MAAGTRVQRDPEDVGCGSGLASWKPPWATGSPGLAPLTRAPSPLCPRSSVVTGKAAGHLRLVPWPRRPLGSLGTVGMGGWCRQTCRNRSAGPRHVFRLSASFWLRVHDGTSVPWDSRSRRGSCGVLSPNSFIHRALWRFLGFLGWGWGCRTGREPGECKVIEFGPLQLTDKGTEAGERRGLPVATGPAVGSCFWTRRQVSFCSMRHQ